VLLVGLTGGLGSGKSTIGEMLRSRGAVVIEADDLARQAVKRGSPGYQGVVEAFGPQVVAPGGELDRGRLAGIVFALPDSRRRLEAIVHPEVRRLFQEAIEQYRSTDRVVVYVVPLLVETGMESVFDVVAVVSAPLEVRVARATGGGRMSEADAKARMAAQVPDEDRERVGDVVIRNDGTPTELEHRVDRLWRDVIQQLRSKGGAGRSGASGIAP
jgi:dephospho-CoA kinase